MSALRLRRLPGPHQECGSAESTVSLIRILLLFEAMLYSAVTPVLPHYAQTLHASKPAIGLLAASYPAGMLPGSLLAGWLATRGSVRRTTVVGLLIFSVSIAAFGFATNIVALDALRFIQGAACGFVWGGGLAWVISVAPRERRGEVLGTVIGAAIFGTMLGPVLGNARGRARHPGRVPGVGVVAIGLALWTLEHPEPRKGRADRPHAAARAGRQPLIVLGFWLILLEAATSAPRHAAAPAAVTVRRLRDA